MAIKTITPDVVSPYLTWPQLYQCLRKTRNVSTYLGLLHGGFRTYLCNQRTTPQQEQELELERLSFYLGLADGCFRMDVTSSHAVTVKKKAYSVLVNEYFGRFQFDHGNSRLEFKNLRPEIIDRLLWFFRPHDETRQGNGGVNAFPPEFGSVTPEMTAAWKFGEKFCKFVWYCPIPEIPTSYEYYEYDSTQLAKSKPRVVSIFSGMGWPSLMDLVPDGRGHWSVENWKRFSDLGVMEELRRIALAHGTTVEEAAARGCAAAQILLLCQSIYPHFSQIKSKNEAMQDRLNKVA